MYILCPKCKESGWIPYGDGIDIEYKNGKFVVPETVLDEKKIRWKCKCFQGKTKNNNNNNN